MPALLKELCDSVINSLESPSEEFQDNIREVFCKMDAIFKQVKDDPKGVEKYCEECRHILVVLRLFPLEFKLAMDTLYKKTLCGFLSIYLDFKMIQYQTEKNKEAQFNNTIKEVFLLLGDEDRTCIWNAVVTSHILNDIEILKLLARRFIEETKKDRFSHDEYIRMVWVLHVFFSQCKKANIIDDADKVLQIAMKLKYPAGLCKWMCHHYPGFGWKGLTDDSVHETLVSEKQPKSFFRQVYQAIAKDDTLKYQLEEINRNGPEDSSSQSSESVIGKKLQSLAQSKESDTLKKSQDDDTVKADKSGNRVSKKKVMEEESTKENESEDLKIKKDLRTSISKDKYQDSDTKSTKTLGPGRTKPTSATSFLDDDEDSDDDVNDEDTLDANIADDRSSDDGKNDKNIKNKSTNHSDDESIEAKKGKVTKKKGKVIEDSSDEESANSSYLPGKKSLRSKQTKNKSPNVTSDSETDINPDNEDLPEKLVKKSFKRKSGDDSDSDQTINGNESAVETKIDERGDHDEDDTNSSLASSGKRTSSNNKSQTRKVVRKKIRIDQSPETTIEQCAEDTETISDDKKLIEEYMKGPFAWIFEKFEEEKSVKGEPFIYLERTSKYVPKYEQDSTLADILHTNNQRAKQKKVIKKKTRKGCR